MNEQPASPLSSNVDDQPGRPRPRLTGRHLLIVTSAGIAGAVLMCAAWKLRSSGGPAIPEVDVVEVNANVAAAIGVAREGVRKKPRSAEAWGRLGMVLQANDFPAAAEQAYLRAEELDPEDPRWPYLFGMGVAQARPDEALEAYRRAVSRPGYQSPARLRLAELLIVLGQWDEAERHFSAAAEAEPHNARAVLGLARSMFHRGELAEARQLVEQAVELAPRKRAPRELLAQILHLLKNHQAASEQLQVLVGLPEETTWEDPLVADVLRLRRGSVVTLQQAQQLLQQGQHSTAIAKLERLVDQDPSAHAFLELGQALLTAGRIDRASSVVEQALVRFPDSPELCRLRGTLAFLQQQWEESARWFGRTIELKPDDATAHYNLGHALLRRDERTAAAAAFRQAVLAQPDFANAHINLARLLADADQLEQAREHLRIGLELAPDDTAALLLKEELQNAQL